MADSSSTPALAAKPLVMRGLYPATITPFAADGSVDYQALRAHLHETLQAPGVTGVVVNSGLGEILQLQPDEQVRMIELALELRRPGQLVVSGIEGHNQDALVASGRQAKEAGADALLVFPPFDRRAYRKLNAMPAAVRNVFARLDAEVDLPMVVFQYPVGSGSAYSIESLEAICELRNVVAIKAATEAHFNDYKAIWNRLGSRVAVLVGVDSPPLLDMLQHGAHGALIGISAIATPHWGALLQLVEAGEHEQASALYRKVCLPLMDSVFQNQQPKFVMSDAAATKEALFQLGCIPSARVRAPAVAPDAAARDRIRRSLEAAGLLPARAAAANA